MNNPLLRISIVQVLENHRIPHSLIVADDIIDAIQAIDAIIDPVVPADPVVLDKAQSDAAADEIPF